MIMKLLLLIVVIAAVYLLFFKSKPIKKPASKDEKPAKSGGDEMVQCETCGTYVALDDAIISNGKYYCSPECLKG
jgi:uncharacterized protein